MQVELNEEKSLHDIDAQAVSAEKTNPVKSITFKNPLNNFIINPSLKNLCFI
jgi:hypothetical protein